MHYYQFHIGDYRAGCIHLTQLERWVYRDLLDVLYDTEKPLPIDLDLCYKLVGARTEEQREAVRSVLESKFQRSDTGYTHSRVEEEIQKYRGKADRARQANQSRWTPKSDGKHGKSEANQNDMDTSHINDASETDLKSDANQIPTTNQETKKPSLGKSRATALPDDFYPDETGVKYAADRGVDLKTQLEQFKNFHTAKGSVFKNWQAAWRTWVGNAESFGHVKPKAEVPWARGI